MTELEQRDREWGRARRAIRAGSEAVMTELERAIDERAGAASSPSNTSGSRRSWPGRSKL